MLSQVAPAVPLVVEHHSRCHEDLMNATIEAPAAAIVDELPMRVREAAVFLGVSPQTVYLWVERKQIPHLRVMGRNIRFLKSELEPFRAQFKQEMGNGKTE
jgi:excisionase family DNA binding protein